MEKRVFELEFNNTKIVMKLRTCQTSKFCLFSKVWIQLFNCNSFKRPNELDFFHLQFYIMKIYAVGKFRGFIKGRTSKWACNFNSTLNWPSVRPLFPEGFRNEVQVVNTALSVDQDKSRNWLPFCIFFSTFNFWNSI